MLVDIQSNILFGILSDIFWQSIWHAFDILFGILSNMSSDLLSGIYLISLWRFFVVEVRQGTLWSWACCSGPAGNTAITSLQLRSGKHFDHKFAIEVRRGTLWYTDILWSWACCLGPAGNTAIRSLQLRSGRGGGGEGGHQLTWNLTTFTRQVGNKFVYMRACDTLTGLNVWNQMLAARMVGVTWGKDSTNRWNLTCTCILYTHTMFPP